MYLIGKIFFDNSTPPAVMHFMTHASFKKILCTFAVWNSIFMPAFGHTYQISLWNGLCTLDMNYFTSVIPSFLPCRRHLGNLSSLTTTIGRGLLAQDVFNIPQDFYISSFTLLYLFYIQHEKVIRFMKMTSSEDQLKHY